VGVIWIGRWAGERKERKEREDNRGDVVAAVKRHKFPLVDDVENEVEDGGEAHEVGGTLGRG